MVIRNGFSLTLFATLIVLLAACVRKEPEPSGVNRANAPPSTTVKEQPLSLVQLGPYSLEIWKTFFVFKKDNHPVYKEEVGADNNVNVAFLLPRKKSGTAELADGKTGSTNGSDLVLERKRPNNTFEYSIFRLGDRVEKVAAVKSGFSRLQLDQSEQDNCKIIGNDWFTDWGATSVAPEVVLCWDGKSISLDRAAMQKRAPSKEALLSLKGVIAERFKDYPRPVGNSSIDSAPPELASEVFELYYCGKGSAARKFYEDCWPKGRQGREKYWAFLMGEVRKSPYWHSIKLLNKEPQQ